MKQYPYADIERAISALEEIYSEAIEFYQESHIQGYYEPAAFMETPEHQLEPVLYELPPGQSSIPVASACQSLHSRLSEHLNRKKAISGLVLAHIQSGPDHIFQYAQHIESANGILFTFYFENTYQFVLPYSDQGDEIIYQEIESLDEAL